MLVKVTIYPNFCSFVLLTSKGAEMIENVSPEEAEWWWFVTFILAHKKVTASLLWKSYNSHVSRKRMGIFEYFLWQSCRPWLDNFAPAVTPPLPILGVKMAPKWEKTEFFQLASGCSNNSKNLAQTSTKSQFPNRETVFKFSK